jgi:hypothetical protein
MKKLDTLMIRIATANDRERLDHLAIVDSSDPLDGDVLVAEVGDELWAAMEATSGRSIADPFRPSGNLVELLTLRIA